MIDSAPFLRYCAERRGAHQFRQLAESEILPDGRIARGATQLINFASNDYLGLSQHPALIQAAQEAAARYGAGATASRLITGNHPLHNVVEQKLARGKGTETALLMASGYQANLTILAALADSIVHGKPVVILADRLAHNSLLQGALLASASGDTKLARFQHNDYAHLENLLRQHSTKGAQGIIVTESVFGMDGDCADLAQLAALAEKYAALLYVDEAHATGLYGADGFGFCADHAGRIDIAMGTFGKALGSFGAYIGCSAAIRDYLIQKCGGLIYSTALPPSILATMNAALDILPALDQQRAHLVAQSARLREALRAQGWDTGASSTHIIPILLGSEESATILANALKTDGMLVPAIRPPTVPRGTSRLRISLSAAHSAADIDHLTACLSRHAPRFAAAA